LPAIADAAYGRLENIGSRLTPAPTGIYNRSIAKLPQS